MRVVLCLLAGALAALSQTAQITGIITDTTKASMPDVKVTVTNSQTGVSRDTVSNQQGNYSLPLLQPGKYQITAQATGFKPISRDGITLEVDQVARIDFVMEVGSLVETIEIRATPPLLETSTGSLGQVIESKQFSDLPLNDRTALGLLALSDGFVPSSGFNPAKFDVANRFSANGSRPGQNEFLLDGTPNTLPGVWPGRGILGTAVPVDAVQEFRVQTTVFSAEFGRTGGGLVNMVSRAGTNEWHGSLFEFLRNSKLDANNFFNNRSGIPLGSFKRNQYGGTLGGPVKIPRLYSGRNRTFFFGHYQGTRASTSETTSSTVPTAAARAGDFSSLATAQGQSIILHDPLTTTTTGGNPMRQPFPGNVIPAGRINPVSAKVAGYYPPPSRSGSVNNLVQSGASRETTDMLGVRLDHVLTSRQQIHGRYNYTRGRPRNADWFGNYARAFVGQNQDVTSLAADYVCTLGPTAVLNVRYGFGDRTHENIDPALGTSLGALGFPAYVDQASAARVFPRFTPSGYLNMGNTDGINAYSYITHSMQQSLTKTAGSHTLKLGADIRLHSVSQNRGIDPSGTYNFTRAFTQGPNANRGAATAGDAFASMLLGTPSSGTFGSVIRPESLNEYYGVYLQDDWKVSARLTLNLGLRYELEMPRKEKLDRLDWFDFDVVSPLNGQVKGLPSELRGGMRFAGRDGNPRRHFDTNWRNFGPRFSFAYQLGGQTVIRGGYGIFYGSGSIGAGGFNIASQGFAPSTTFVGSLDGLQPIATLSDPFPNGFASAVGSGRGLLSLVGQSVARVYERNAPLPYNQQWTLSVQRQVASVLLQTAYSASRGVHLGDGAGFAINQLPPSALRLGSALQNLVPNPFFGVITDPGPLNGPTVTRGQLLRPYPHFDALTIFNPAQASSTYHGLSLKAERRFGAGLGFLASYTTSKSINDAPPTVGGTTGHQNTYDRRADRSLAEEDIAQRFVTSASWELPFGKAKRFGAHWNQLADGLLGGWQLNAIVTMQSGTPLALSSSPNTSGALGGKQRPNSRGFSAARSGPVQSRLDAFLDASAFLAPEPFTHGNVARTLPDVRGPRTSNLDLSLFKTFRIGEATHLQFRAEMFNAANTPIFDLPNQAFGSVAFGTITSQRNDPRQVQFGLRLFF